MNADRRKRLDSLLSALEGIEANLDDLRNEEQEACDNLPENLQNGERGEAMQAAVERIEDAIERVTEARDAVGEAMQ